MFFLRSRIRRPELRFRCPDPFLMPTHRERSIKHSFGGVQCILSALKPLGVQESDFRRAQTDSLLVQKAKRHQWRSKKRTHPWAPKMMRSSKKRSPSTLFCSFFTFPLPLFSLQDLDHGNGLFSNSYIHLGHIFLPSLKIFKIDDTRSFNVQRHHPKYRFRKIEKSQKTRFTL